MSTLSILQRVQNILPGFIRQNTLSDALLGAASDELSYLDAKTEAWNFGADDVRPERVNVATGSPTAVISLTTYTAGTVTTVSGSRRLVGVGTAWLASVSPGDTLTVSGESASVVFQVIDNTTLDLTNVMSSSSSGRSYSSQGTVDLTAIFKIGDNFVLAGSTQGYSGVYQVTAVSSSSVTVAGSFGAPETGLLYGSQKARLLARARSLLLFPGGYETDAQLTAQLLAATTTHEKRGSTAGLVSDLNVISNGGTVLIDSIKPAALLQSGVSSTSGGAALTVDAWASGLTVGTSFMLGGSTLRSSGRYWVYANSGTAITPARRPVHSYSYFPYQSSGIELQFREDRLNQRVYFRVNNPGAVASKTIAGTVTVSGVGSVTASVPVGASYTVGVAANVVSFTWTLASNEPFREGWINVGSLSSAVEFVPAVSESSTGTAMQIVRLGSGGLSGRTVAGAVDLTALARWKWGGLIKTTFLSQTAESGLTVYGGPYHGFYINIGYPGLFENDPYSITAPKNLVVAEVDNRNVSNYSNTDIKNIVRDYLIPVDADYLIEFV